MGLSPSCATYGVCVPGRDVTTSLKVDFYVSEAGLELLQGLRKIVEPLDQSC